MNFLTLRSEILSILGVLGPFVLYQSSSRWRRNFVWLLPPTVGAFAKQSAIIFAPLLTSLTLFHGDLRASRRAGSRLFARA